MITNQQGSSPIGPWDLGGICGCASFNVQCLSEGNQKDNNNASWACGALYV